MRSLLKSLVLWVSVLRLFSSLWLGIVSSSVKVNGKSKPIAIALLRLKGLNSQKHANYNPWLNLNQIIY